MSFLHLCLLTGACAWQERYPEGKSPKIGVNLSAKQFEHPDLARDVAKILPATGLEPGSLELEITESVAMGHAPSTMDTFKELKALGGKLAIDDFGTGYSSLSYLKRFPVDNLKIDRSFINELGDDENGTVLMSGVLRLARALGLGVIAEGVETAQQLMHLRDLGCELAQGYFFWKPVPGERASELLAARLN